jgi:hypothetical protein
MTTFKRLFKSDAFEVIHASATALHQVGPSAKPPCVNLMCRAWCDAHQQPQVATVEPRLRIKD